MDILKSKKGTILDSPEKMKTLDSESQFEMISRWPELIRDVIDRTEQINLPKKVKAGSRILEYNQDFSEILICGMGGSAIGGAYAEAYLRDLLHIPVLINRKHTPPHFVGPSTLTIVCSYSGNTEETVQSFLAILERESPIVVISSGGIITSYCENLGIPILRVEPGYRPRASLPLLFPPIPVFVSRLIESFDYKSDFNEALNILENLQDEIGVAFELATNQAKQVAGSIAGTIPMVCSSIGCLAYRMRCQLNENAKLPAIDLEFPELGHNHIMGFESHARNLMHLSLMILALNSEKKELNVRIDYLKELASNLGIPVCSYEAQGQSLLSQMLSLTYFGDYVSLYTSVLQGVDPSPTTTIDEMKTRIERESPWMDEAKAFFRSITL